MTTDKKTYYLYQLAVSRLTAPFNFDNTSDSRTH